jgi:(2Fe-2S) ferredoxin
MEQERIPYRRTVFVCTNARTDGRVACANEGRCGKELCEALKEKIKEMGLKGKIRVARSGCLDLCAQGPNLFIYPDGDWYSGVRLDDIPEILKRIAAD